MRSAILFCAALFQQFKVTDFADATDGDIFPRRHFIAHEILKDYSNFAMQIFQIVVAKIDSIQQNLAFGGVVEAGDQFYDRRLALSVFANQGQPFIGMEGEINLVQHATRISRITERNVPEFHSANNWPGRGQGIGLGLDCRLHFKKSQQVGKEQCLITDTGKGGENLFDVTAGLLNRSGEKRSKYRC